MFCNLSELQWVIIACKLKHTIFYFILFYFGKTQPPNNHDFYENACYLTLINHIVGLCRGKIYSVHHSFDIALRYWQSIRTFISLVLNESAFSSFIRVARRAMPGKCVLVEPIYYNVCGYFLWKIRWWIDTIVTIL